MTSRRRAACIVAVVTCLGVVRSEPAAAAPPSPVTDLSVVVGQGFLTAYWSPPTMSDSPITAYSVVAQGPDNAVAAWTNVLADMTQASVAPLVNGVRYTVSVLAWNSTGRSVASVSGRPRASGLEPITPGPPSSVTFTPSNGPVTVRWTPPPTPGVKDGRSDGGYPIVAYSVVLQYGKPPYLVQNWINAGPDAREVTCECPATMVHVFAWNALGAGTPRTEGFLPP
jgi:hypothetical protein